MSGYGITPLDVKNAVDNENVELPFRKYRRKHYRAHHPVVGSDAYSRRVQQSYPEGDGNRIVRFSDIGRAELGPADIQKLYEDRTVCPW